MQDWKKELMDFNVDVNGSIERFSGREDRYIKYLKRFGEDTNFEDMKYAVEKGDVQAAFGACHTLKRLTGNLGFDGLTDTVCEVCEMLRAGSLEGVKEKIETVNDNYFNIINVIKTLL